MATKGEDSCTKSERPILELQVGNFAEVLEVAGEKSSVVGEGNGGHLQVHRPDTNFRSPETLKDFGGSLIEIQNSDIAVELKMLFQPSIGGYLGLRRLSLCADRKPPSRLLFITDDCRGKIVRGDSNDLTSESYRLLICSLQQSHVIRVHQVHCPLHRSLRFEIRATRVHNARTLRIEGRS